MNEHDAAVRLQCPNAGEPRHAGFVGYDLIVRRQARGFRFRCTDCLAAFTMTEAEVRRVMVRRMVMA